MVKNLLIAAGLAFLPFGCSDSQEETEEAVQMPGDDSSMMDDPAMPDDGGSLTGDLGASTESPGLNDLAGGAEGAMNDMMGSGDGGSLFVRCNVLRIRSGPGISHKTVGFVTFNKPVSVIGNPNAKWVKIGEGQFMSRKYLNNQKNAKAHIPAH